MERAKKTMDKATKKKAALVITAIVILVAGITYAWFSWVGNSTSSDVTVGRLRVDALQYEDYENDETGEILRYYPGKSSSEPDLEYYTPTESWLDSSVLFQPNKDGALAFEVSNLNPDNQALSSTIKIGNMVKSIEIWSDEDGNPLSTAEVYSSTADLEAAHSSASGAVSYGIDTDSIYNAEFVDAQGNQLGAILWCYDKNLYDTTGEIQYYVSINPVPTEYASETPVEVLGRLAFDRSAGNLFQGAVITLDSSFEATQSIAEAAQDMWGSNVSIAPLSWAGVSIPTQTVVLTTGGDSITSTASAPSRRMSVSDSYILDTYFPELIAD